MTLDNMQPGGGDESGSPPPAPQNPNNDQLAKRYLVGFTDYPFTQVGDVPHEPAPIRLCWIVGWDCDKYVTIQVVGIEHLQQIKRGYVYKTPGRCGEAEVFTSQEIFLAVRDNCQVCNGENGGMLGNENIVNGWVVCDYCHAAHRTQ